MQGAFKAVKVSDHVYWVGAIDWYIRDFHGYSTERGTTYNAYLILADKVTLVDGVKASFKDELLARVASVIDPREIRYVVSNHSELDHSGCLAEVIDLVKPEKLFASDMGVKDLGGHFPLNGNVEVVKDGQTVDIGGLHLSFIETRMLHWPDSMFSYLPEEGILFSSDAFGMHMATSERFDDEVIGWRYQAAKYYANILMPFSPLVTRLLEKVKRLELSPRLIAPDHGPIWRRDITTILKMYGEWAVRKPTRKAVIAYDTMWDSTAAMARAISEGLAEGGASTKVLPLRASHRSDVATELLDAGALMVGSSTLNNNLLPTVADLLTYIRGLKPRNLVGNAFGSYGWSGEAVDQVKAALEGMGVELVGESAKARFVPDREMLQRCYKLGLTTAARLRELAPPS